MAAYAGKRFSLLIFAFNSWYKCRYIIIHKSCLSNAIYFVLKVELTESDFKKGAGSDIHDVSVVVCSLLKMLNCVEMANYRTSAAKKGALCIYVNTLGIPCSTCASRNKSLYVHDRMKPSKQFLIIFGQQYTRQKSYWSNRFAMLSSFRMYLRNKRNATIWAPSVTLDCFCQLALGIDANFIFYLPTWNNPCNSKVLFHLYMKQLAGQMLCQLVLC